jgi:isoamylase
MPLNIEQRVCFYIRYYRAALDARDRREARQDAAHRPGGRGAQLDTAPALPELSWLNWKLDDERRQLLEFVKQLTELHRTQAVLRRRTFFQGRKIRGSQVKDVAWFEPSGQEMSDEAWDAGFVKCLGVRWAGDAIDEVDERGERIKGDTLLLLFNAHHEPIPFTLPAHRANQNWQRVLDTMDPQAEPQTLQGGSPYELQAHSLAVLRIEAVR